MPVNKRERQLDLWRDDDETPISKPIRLDGDVFDVTGSSAPVLRIYEDEPQDETVPPLFEYVGIYVDDEESGGSRAVFEIPREDLEEAHDSWWHRAFLETATGKRKSFSRGRVVVHGQ